MPALREPHRIAVLVPELVVEGSDACPAQAIPRLERQSARRLREFEVP
jgi:hypothetical protein